ncbi:AMP-binding protein [Candidatus Chloroploca sp. Khr17]|uniref:AMP-binding protein n=1 Tax=Candidatus Chloroploca sp. Khr17 TaxID=2496869 RepID=UPI0013EA9DA5|nr:AMP-binding protein [Candidatus Chloroploca sp. Khr17]
MPSSLVEALRSRVEHHPQRDALIFIGPSDTVETITYGQFDMDARRYAGLLQANEVQPGDLVIVAFEHSYKLVAAFWGALYAGAVPTIFPYRDATGSGEARQRRLVALAAFTDAHPGTSGEPRVAPP